MALKIKMNESLQSDAVIEELDDELLKKGLKIEKASEYKTKFQLKIMYGALVEMYVDLYYSTNKCNLFTINVLLPNNMDVGWSHPDDPEFWGKMLEYKDYAELAQKLGKIAMHFEAIGDVYRA